MRTGIAAVCRRPAALGLGLAGLACHEVVDSAGAAAAIAALAATPEVHGLILIERELHDALPAPLRRQLRRGGLPILMPFPGPALGAAGRAADDELVEVLRRSIGYRLRLR